VSDEFDMAVRASGSAVSAAISCAGYLLDGQRRSPHRLPVDRVISAPTPYRTVAMMVCFRLTDGTTLSVMQWPNGPAFVVDPELADEILVNPVPRLTKTMEQVWANDQMARLLTSKAGDSRHVHTCTIANVGSTAFSPMTLVRDFIAALDPLTSVVSGVSPGVDRVVAEAASARRMRVQLFEADQDAGTNEDQTLVDQRMADATDTVVVFMSDFCREALSAAITALRRGKPIRVIGPNGRDIPLRTILEAAGHQGVIAALGSVDRTIGPIAAIFCGVLRREKTCWAGNDQRAADCGVLIEVFGVDHIKAVALALDRMSPAEGWGGLKPIKSDGFYAEMSRSSAIEMLREMGIQFGCIPPSRQTSDISGIQALEAYVFTMERDIVERSTLRFSNYGDRIILSGCVSTDCFRARSLYMDVTPAKWKAVRSAFAASRFWTLPPDAPERRLVLDGESWRIEGYREGCYHCIDRTSPHWRGAPPDSDNAIVTRLGVALAELAGATEMFPRTK
jgi:hypothetical protein